MASGLVLKVEEINPYQFVNTTFPMSVLLVNTETDQPKTGETLSLKLFVVYEGAVTGSGSKVDDILEVVSNTGIQTSGVAFTQLKINQVSMKHDNRRFVIYLEAIQANGNVVRATSNPITCVQHKLIIQEENVAPYVWFKDEGGKDKCIELKAMLIDANNNLVKNRFVPLRAVLTYSGGQPVQQQNILAVSPDSKAFIDDHGFGKIKIRINEVSNRHRGQMFQILISPDISQQPSSADISPALSVPVEVKSKRNSSTKKSESFSSYMSGGYVPLSSDSYQEVDSKKARFELGPGSASVGTGSLLAAVPSLLPLHYPFSSPVNQVSVDEDLSGSLSGAYQFNTSAATAPFPTLDNEQCEQSKRAFKTMVGWTQHVLSAVQAMQWIQIGFERSNPLSPDGSSYMDAHLQLLNGANRPLYSMSNPNDRIREIVELYKDGGKESMEFLRDFLDNHLRQIQTQQAILQQQQAQQQLVQSQLQMQQAQNQQSMYRQNGAYGYGSHYSLPSITKLDAGDSSSNNTLYGSVPYHSQYMVPPNAYLNNSSVFTPMNNELAMQGLVSQELPANLMVSPLTGPFNPQMPNYGSAAYSNVVNVPDSLHAPSKLHAPLGASTITISTSPRLPVERDEQQVSIVLARTVSLGGRPLGLPAFSEGVDGKPELRGFYEDKQIGDKSVVYFKPVRNLSALLSHNNNELLIQITRQLELEMSHGEKSNGATPSPAPRKSVFRLSECRDLESLKTDAVCAGLLYDLECDVMV